MRCYICNTLLTDPEFDERGSKPCSACQEEVNECLEAYEPEEKSISLEEYLELYGEAIQVS